MPIDLVNVGTVPNDFTGDPLRDAFIKINNMFQEVYGFQPSGAYFTGPAYYTPVGGLTVEVIWPEYFIDGVLYPAGSGEITLNDANDTFDRFDAIFVDASGLNYIAGEPSLNPEQPILDTTSQIRVTYVLVEANVLDLTVSDLTVFDENTEFTVTSDNITVDPDSTADPVTGLKLLDVGSFTAGESIVFTDGSNTYDKLNYGQLRLFLWLKDEFDTGTYLRFAFYNNGVAVSQTYDVLNGFNNFNREAVAQWQTIVIPIASFIFTSNQFDEVRIIFSGANATGFKLDYFQLQTGISVISPLQNTLTSIVTDDGVANADQPSDSFGMVGANGLEVSASGKVITVTQKDQAVPYANLAGFPVTGESGVIYMAEDTNFLYRWDGAVYVQIGGGNAVESVTGDGVDNTDPLNPILTFPTPSDIGAVESVTGDGVDNTDPLNPILTFPTPSDIGAVESVTGDGVDNTDPLNPILTFPTPSDIGAVESVTGDGVDNTDPLNPILTFPTPSDIGAVESVTGDGVDNTDPLNPIINIPVEVQKGTAAGTDTYTTTITGVAAYAAQDIYLITFTNANTGASTINVNSLGAKSLKKSFNVDLEAGDIAAGQQFFIVYDGTNFQVIGIGGGGGGGHEIQDEGTPLTQRAALNFVGASVTVTDDSLNDATVVTITNQFSQLQDEADTLLTVEPTTKFVGHDVVNDSVNDRNIVNRQHESQYRFEIVTTIDQDIWLNNSTIFKIVKSAGVDTAEYRIGVGAWVPISFTGDTWTGTLNITAAQVLSWRITYTGGFTTAALIVQHKRTL
jgi:hypothetical protein